MFKYQFLDIKEQKHQASYFMVPSWWQKNSNFVGRMDLLKTLRDKLCEDKPQEFNHRVALFGMGGVGKTQVAIEYVVRYKHEYNAIFWITAGDLASLLLGFQEIAEVTKCANTKSSDAASLAREVLKWLNKQSSWLLVMDNVDDISGVKGYLPDVTTGEGHLLLTTRDPNAIGISARGLEVEVFDPQTAADMLLLRANRADNDNMEIRSEAVKIVTELGFLALAIEQAAAYIRESLKDIFRFLPVYSVHRGKVLAQRPRGDWPYPYVVATTWSLSFEIVKDRNPDAAQLLNLFAFLNPDEILVEFLEAGRDGLPEPLKNLIADTFEFPNALGELEQYSLIRRPGDGRIISMHRLVQAVIKDSLVNEDERSFMEMVTALFLIAFPEFDEDKRQICRRYQTQVVGPLVDLMGLGTEDIAKLLLRVAYFLYADGKYFDGEHLARKAVEIYIALFGHEDYRTLTGMNNLASTYDALGRMKEAAALHETVLEAGQRTWGGEHPDTLMSMNNLAETYHALGRMKEAAALHEKVLEARQRTLGDEHPNTLSSMNNLAETYRALGRMKEAAALHEKVLEARRRTSEDEHPHTLTSMNNLALTYGDLGRMKEAAVLHEKVLEARRRTLGDEHPDTLTSMNNLASTYRDLGRMKEAAVLHEKVLEARRRTLGDEHPNTLTSMNNLALTYRALGRMKEAAILHEKVLEARRRTLGDEHPDTLSSMYNLATAYWSLGHRNQGIALYEMELDKSRVIYGAEHAETLTSMENLAYRYREVGRVANAVVLESNLKKFRNVNRGDNE